jgi:hypothetical protein
VRYPHDSTRFENFESKFSHTVRVSLYVPTAHCTVLKNCATPR